MYKKSFNTSGVASGRHNSRFASAYLTKLGNSRFATVTARQSLRDCDSAYLTKWGNSRFATVTLHITPRLSFAVNGSLGLQVGKTVAKRLVLLPRLINMQSQSREATVAQSQSRSDCYPILLNMQRHSREATVMPRRHGEAASKVINVSV